MKNHGMTLVEVIMTSVLSAIIGGIAFTIFFICTNQVDFTSLYSKMSLHYDIVITQIGQKTRSAKYILNDSDGYPPTNTISSQTNTIWMKKDPNGIITGGYKIENGNLKEYLNNNWSCFKIGENEVKITSPSNFIISSDRKQVTVNISVIANHNGKCDTLNSIQEVFLCRN